jgi:hypothetical protein
VSGFSRTTIVFSASREAHLAPLAGIGRPENPRAARTLTLRGGQGLSIIDAQEGSMSGATPSRWPYPPDRRDRLASRGFS